MKPSLKVGLSTRREIVVDEQRCIGFMGKEGMVYATPRMVSDVEYAIRDYLLEHLEPGEDSVGAHVSIDHLAATPMGLKVTIEAKIVEVDRRRVTFEFTVHDSIEQCGRGKHVRFVVEKAKTEGRRRYLHAFPPPANGASNAICRKLGFTLLGEVEFEFPPGNFAASNDWRLDLTA